MLRELRRTVAAIRGTGGGAGARPAPSHMGRPVSRTRAVMQIVLTVLLVPLCLWVLFGSASYGETARRSASAVLGAVVAFWLKD